MPALHHRGEVQFVLGEELTLLKERGYDNTAYRAEFDKIAAMPPEKNPEAVELLLDLHARVERDPGKRSPDWTYEEPSDLPSIRAARPDGPRQIEAYMDAETLQDRVYGAWLGRIAGCMLGKPIEGWPFAKIKKLGEYIGEWPLEDYIPDLPDAPKELIPTMGDKHCLRGNITHGVRDDDTDYTILGLKIMERHGPDFTSDDVASMWLHSMPICYVYTAERVAYRNLVNYINPPESALYLNGFREWIGAQIRADFWGYVTPGLPELAAEFAHRDACVSHVANGIYGEMYFAAAISAALVYDDIHKVLQAGLNEIPANCRLAEAIRDTIEIAARHKDWESAWHEVAAKYNHYHTVHTINNACFVVLGLLFSLEDFEKAITLAVMGGEDVDCTGATAGSIIGALLGAKALPEKWIAPLNDRLLSVVMDFHDNQVSDLAQRTMQQIARVRRDTRIAASPDKPQRPDWE